MTVKHDKMFIHCSFLWQCALDNSDQVLSVVLKLVFVTERASGEIVTTGRKGGSFEPKIYNYTKYYTLMI